MNLLHIDSSILGAHSVSRILSAAVVARLQADHPGGVTVTYRDLAAAPLLHLSGSYLAAAGDAGAPQPPEMQQDLAIGGAVLQEFLAADVVVIGVAFYNFGIASQLKAWIDRVVIAGKTFRYTEKGPEGLAGNKRVILAVARGGFYGPGTPAESFEHAETYLRTTFGFLGIRAVEVVQAEGIALGAEQRAASVEHALTEVAALPASA